MWFIEVVWSYVKAFFSFLNGVLVGQLQRLSNLVFCIGKVNITVWGEDTGRQGKRETMVDGYHQLERPSP